MTGPEIQAQSRFQFKSLKENKENYEFQNFFLGNVGGRGVLRRNYTGKKPVVIQHRTPDAANYYDHENVS